MVLSKTRTLSSASRCVPMIRTLGRAWAISEDIERANNNLSGYEKLLSRVMAQRAQSSIWGKAVIPQGMTPYGKTHGGPNSATHESDGMSFPRRASWAMLNAP